MPLSLSIACAGKKSFTTIRSKFEIGYKWWSGANDCESCSSRKFLRGSIRRRRIQSKEKHWYWILKNISIGFSKKIVLVLGADFLFVLVFSKKLVLNWYCFSILFLDIQIHSNSLLCLRFSWQNTLKHMTEYSYFSETIISF